MTLWYWKDNTNQTKNYYVPPTTTTTTNSQQPSKNILMLTIGLVIYWLTFLRFTQRTDTYEQNKITHETHSQSIEQNNNNNNNNTQKKRKDGPVPNTDCFILRTLDSVLFWISKAFPILFNLKWLSWRISLSKSN